MPGPVSVGDVAPNFDLSSTEGAVLMLKDEVIRTAVVLYFFSDLSARSRQDLDALNQRLERLKEMQCRVMAVSPAKLDDLKKAQAESRLLFPLLHDDRGFSALYGDFPALVVVDRHQTVRWLASPVVAVEEVMPQLEWLLDRMPSPTKAYPKSVINRVVDFWVNR